VLASSALAGAGWSVEKRWGGRHPPPATAAATDAICSGLASTRPWPMEAAAFSAVSAGWGNWPANDGTGSWYLSPNPKAAACPGRAGSGSLAASCTKAVLHEIAKAWWNGIGPGGASPSKFLNGLPPTVAWGGQVVGVSAVAPPTSSAAVVT